MHAASRTAAARLRAHLLRGRITPASFRAELERTPPGERDAWFDVLCDMGDVANDDAVLPRGCVPYLPCPVATVLEAVQRADVTSDDVFVDVGSGAGRTAFFVHLLTGAECIGVEIQPALVDAARARAASLHLERIRFVQGDAAELLRSVTAGSVFFLYCPFSGERLDRVLDELEAMARTREIRLCCVQMPPVERPWLVRVPTTSVELDVYRSNPRAPGGVNTVP